MGAHIGYRPTGNNPTGYTERNTAIPVSPYTYAGQNYGFNPDSQGVDRFPFASDTNATDVGDMVNATSSSSASHHSSTHAYQTTGGTNGQPSTSIIEKYPVATTGFTATDVGDLTQARYSSNGTHSETHGYTSGGNNSTPSPTSYANESNVIDRYPFAADANAADVGNLLSNTGSNAAGVTDDVNSKGYHCGGMWPRTNTIQVYSFASSSNSSDTGGNIWAAANFLTGNASDTHGYVSGGRVSPSDPGDNQIGKFSFASVGNTSDVGNLTAVMAYGAGHDATGYGYVSGGRAPPSTPLNIIQKFPFASDANAADVGDLTTARTSQGKGTQS